MLYATVVHQVLQLENPATIEKVKPETYGYFTSRTQKFPYPSFEAIKTALDMLSDQYPQAKSVILTRWLIYHS